MSDILRLTRDNRLIAFSLMLWGIGDGLFFYIQPLYLKELGANPVTIGSVLALAGLASAVSHIPAGYVADRWGRKPVLVAGWAFGAVGGLLMYAARGLPVFTAGLLLYMFTGFVLAPINSYVSEARGEQSVQRALTLVSAGFLAGALVSPTVGGFIGQAFGLRTVYGLATVTFIISTIALLPLTPQPPTPPAAGQTRYGPLFRNRRFLGFVGLMLVALFSTNLGLPFSANFVQEVRHFDVSVVGLLGSINSFGAMMINLALGHSRPRLGFMLGQVLTVLWLTLLLWAPGLGWLAAAYFLRAGWNLSRSMATAQVGRVVDKPEIGLAFGLLETVVALVLTAGPLAAGFLYDRSPALPFQASLGLTAFSLALVWQFAPRRDAHTVEAAVAVAEETVVRES